MEVLDQEYFILRLARLTWPSEWTCNGEGLSFFFFREGSGDYAYRGGKHRLASDSVMVVSSAAGGKICPTRGGEMVFWTFSLLLEDLFPLFATSEVSLLQDVGEELRTPKLHPPSHPVAHECHQLVKEVPARFSLDHRVHLLRVAAVVLNEEFKAARARRVGFVGIEDHLLQVFEKLSAEELLSLSVGDLAKRFGCSRRHLNRLFHNYFGTSVAALRMEMRLLKAGVLLRDPTAKIINVAENCGFNHLGLFNACFKRRYGDSPGKWRKLRAHSAPRSLEGSNGEGLACPLRSNGLCPWNERLGESDLRSLVAAGASAQSNVRGVKAPSPTQPRLGIQQLPAVLSKSEAQSLKKGSASIRP
jgi:AraC-like DNA-binding protein